MSKPVIGSLKTMLTCETAMFRGSGATSTMSTVGAIMSTTQLSLAEPTSGLPARSAIPAPAAVRVRA